ncbi:MAG TPA: hypothetical protein VFT59_00060 [Candidatus Saccharimonadales bacterium]|nr:hypothetical protein [Candidatus Saccharimonadales bacterium]
MNRTTKISFLVLLLLLVTGSALAAYSMMEIRDLKSENSSLKSDIAKNKEEIETTNRIAFSLPHEAYSLRRLALGADEDKLYMPELKIRIPYSSDARSLLYTLRTDLGEEIEEVDVTTDKFMPPQESTTLNCSLILRLKIEDKQNPYNPAEKATSFKLNNGKTLQVYAFTGGVEDDSQCKQLYTQQNFDPGTFVKAFENVESY